MVYCNRKAEDSVPRGEIPNPCAKTSPGNHVLPLPFPCLTVMIDSKVCSNNQEPIIYITVFFSSHQTVVWMLRKVNGLGVTCI